MPPRPPAPQALDPDILALVRALARAAAREDHRQDQAARADSKESRTQ